MSEYGIGRLNYTIDLIVIKVLFTILIRLESQISKEYNIEDLAATVIFLRRVHIIGM